MDLAQKKCVACEGGFPALTKEQAKDFHVEVPKWSMNEEATVISRTFSFKDFKEALAFTNEVGKLAEEDWHHPDLKLSWGKVEISLTTHAVKGLSENDFILAAKIDLLPLP